MSESGRHPQRPVLKLLSDSLEGLECRDTAVFYSGRRVGDVEVAGVCIEANRGSMRILDFCGEISATHGGHRVECGCSYVFTCRPYLRDGVVNLHCRFIRKIDIFEELFFWAEAANLRRHCHRQGTD